MSEKQQANFAEAHAAASRAFRALPPAQMRQRLREAGVLGIAPQIGDKVRVLGRLNDWRYGVVIGADGEGRINIVRNEGGFVALQSLQDFAEGHRVQLVARPPEGQEYAAAARAAGLIGQRFDLALFQLHSFELSGSTLDSPRGLRSMLSVLGLNAAEVVLTDDKEWEEETGRYRDARLHLAAG